LNLLALHMLVECLQNEITYYKKQFQIEFQIVLEENKFGQIFVKMTEYLDDFTDKF